MNNSSDKNDSYHPLLQSGSNSPPPKQNIQNRKVHFQAQNPFQEPEKRNITQNNTAIKVFKVDNSTPSEENKFMESSIPPPRTWTKILDSLPEMLIFQTKTYNCRIKIDQFQMTIETPEELRKWFKIQDGYFNIPIFYIGSINFEKRNEKFKVEIITKDFRVFNIWSGQDLPTMLENNVKTLQLLLSNSQNIFAFHDYASKKIIEDTHKGWNFYIDYEEWERQNLCLLPNDAANDKNTKYLFQMVSNKKENNEYRFCESYGASFVIPTAITYDCLKAVCNYRSNSRIPILSYFWENRSIKRKFATLWRSAQVKAGMNLGFGQNRCLEDEYFIKLIGEPEYSYSFTDFVVRSQTFLDKDDATCIVYDMRPRLNAVGNKITGKGYEIKDNYRNIEIEFMGIENIHKARDSFKKICQLSEQIEKDSKFYKSLDETGWLDFLSKILYTSLKVIETMKKGINVLIHCSDGWDRTSQVSAMTMLIIDPFYRTFKGFAVLIEKEWLHAGHDFATRNGLFDSKKDHSSPIFFMFLDCVHQLWFQNIESFEFNLEYLNEMAYHVYSGVYGTFLGANEKARDALGVRKKTVSFFSYAQHNLARFKNKLYDKNKRTLLGVKYQNGCLRYWREHFLKNSLSTDPINPTFESTWQFYNKLIQYNKKGIL